MLSEPILGPSSNCLLAFEDPGGAKAALSIFYRQMKSCRKIDVFSEVGESNISYFPGLNTKRLKKIPNSFHCYDYIVLGTSYPVTSAIAVLFGLEAKQRSEGLKTIAIVDRNNLVRERFLFNGRYYFPDILYTCECLTSDDREWFEENGVIVKQIFNPYHLYLRDVSEILRKDSGDTRSTELEGLNYVVYAPEPISRFSLYDTYGFDEMSILDELVEIVDEVVPQLEIVFLPHPNQVLEIPEAYGGRVSIVSKSQRYGFNQLKLLVKSKAVISFNSSIIAEALELGCLVYRPLWNATDELKSKITYQNRTSSSDMAFLDKGDFVSLMATKFK